MVEGIWLRLVTLPILFAADAKNSDCVAASAPIPRNSPAVMPVVNSMIAPPLLVTRPMRTPL